MFISNVFCIKFHLHDCKIIRLLLQCLADGVIIIAVKKVLFNMVLNSFHVALSHKKKLFVAELYVTCRNVQANYAQLDAAGFVLYCIAVK